MMRSPSSHESQAGTGQGRPFYRRPVVWKAGLVILLFALVVHYCSNSHKKTGPAPQPVVMAVARSADVPVYLSGLGTVTPTYSVTVRTQVNGQLMEVLFKEGQQVTQGQLLAIIDPRPYEAQLIQYEGQLLRDQALLANALVDLNRYKKLWAQNSVARQIYDTQIATVKQDQGTVKIDQGLIAATKLNLYYTRIIAPVNGRIGLRLVDPGNYVQTSDTNGLAIIDTLNPITVISTLPEDAIPQVMEQLRAGKTLSVIAYDRSQTKKLATGTLLTMDNQVDPTTGTVKLRSQFNNTGNMLFPNQFVNINVLVNILKQATVVPTAAIQHGADGSYIYVVHAAATPQQPLPSTALSSEKKPDMVVKSMPVTIGVSIDDETTVTQGIAPGDTVVIEGADKLADGAPVYVAGSTPAAGVTTHHGRKSA